ncbi:MAG: 2-phospho-L-lactate transferase [Deltaproteobacteria bacterium]|nr:MAG: 2-phospho-L-lactate transferase [Deltaproteobacteria bacterium]
MSANAGPVVALAGGVGAARFLRGLVAAMPADELVVIGNTGDDKNFYGVHVSPDLDIVIYTLAGVVHPERGYGLAGDRFTLVDALARFGHETWFRLGDRDYATCLHRTLRLRAGAGLSEVTDEIRRRFGLELRILPMSEDPCPTLIELEGGRRSHFEDYLARDGAPEDVCGVDLSAAAAARPGPDVEETLRGARAILVCPSNPVVSIGPILAVPGVREAIAASAAPVVAVSPIVGGAPVKGPADRLLRAIGVEVSARGVARHYGTLLGGFVLDQRDAAQAPDVKALGIQTRVIDTIMSSADASARLARATLELAEALR